MMAQALALGTVQFGSHYGISNDQSVPSKEDLKNILNTARKSGVDVIDTASLYKNSENTLGQYDLSGFSIVTKTPTFHIDTINNQHADKIEKSFLLSLELLKQDSLYALLVHQPDDLLKKGGALLWNRLEKLKKQGLIKKIGVSVYDSKQIDQLMEQYKIDLIQLPVNVLDQRLINSGHLEKIKKSGSEIHIRSVFLQGLLLMDNLPHYFNPIASYIKKWRETAAQQEMSLTQAALSFVKSLDEVDKIIIGITNEKQLRQCIDDFNVDKKFNADTLACDIPEFVNPSHWPKNNEAV